MSNSDGNKYEMKRKMNKELEVAQLTVTQESRY